MVICKVQAKNFTFFLDFGLANLIVNLAKNSNPYIVESMA
ncbi:hypothetical protein ENHAE0001_0018 [Enhydrobacter aerosaccus SK60]|nr:hypothetical protein ENHAE0001_0018 [Enhydrobacter aerosaccus SK60]